MAQTLTFRNHESTSPTQALHLLRHDVPSPGAGQVLVKILAAPINPLDLFVLQEKYPIKPENSEQGQQIPGYDGAGRVMGYGENVVGLNVGDQVIIKRHGLGTWRTHGLFVAKDLLKIPNGTTPVAAAILRMGILTAYLLLENNSDKIRPGDWIILNAATGVIAHFLVQFAHKKGLNTISVVRHRLDMSETRKSLRNHGTDIVLEESELSTTTVFESKKIMLGFDAVFGATGRMLIDKLSAGATYVTYGFLGGMTPDTHILINPELIWLKNITFKGFRSSAALSALTDDEQRSLCVWVTELFTKGQLSMPLLQWENWDADSVEEEALRQAICKAQEALVGQHKIVFVFS